MGPNISYVDADQADPLPFQLRTGVAYDVVQSQFNTLTLTVDFAKLLVNRTLAVPDVVDSNGVIITPGIDLQPAVIFILFLQIRLSMFFPLQNKMPASP